MSSISTRTEMDLSTTIRFARSAQRPWTRELACAVVIAEDRLSRVERNSRECGRQWTLARLRAARAAIIAALRTNGGGA